MQLAGNQKDYAIGQYDANMEYISICDAQANHGSRVHQSNRSGKTSHCLCSWKGQQHFLATSCLETRLSQFCLVWMCSAFLIVSLQWCRSTSSGGGFTTKRRKMVFSWSKSLVVVLLNVSCNLLNGGPGILLYMFQAQLSSFEQDLDSTYNYRGSSLIQGGLSHRQGLYDQRCSCTKGAGCTQVADWRSTGLPLSPVIQPGSCSKCSHVPCIWQQIAQIQHN